MELYGYLKQRPHVGYTQTHGFQNWTGLGSWTVKIGNQDENRFFKPKEPNFLLIP